MLTIGNLTLDVPFYQAPLSGYTDRAMRLLARRFGCPLTFTGVVLDKSALHERTIDKAHLRPVPEEHPVGVQVLGSDPGTMARAAQMFEHVGFDVIDLNFACPAPKVLRRGRGGALLTDPDAVVAIIRAVRRAVSVPVMVKLRIGADETDGLDNFRRICELASAEGVAAVGVHGRSVCKLFRGRADWAVICETKSRFPGLTVVGSGDLMTPQVVVERIRTSGADGVMIARGAIGNPWIFTEVRELLQGRPLPPPPSLAEQAKVMLEHFEMVLTLRDETKAVRYFRKFAAGYCKRHPERIKAQLAIMAARTAQQVRDAIRHWHGL